MKWTKWFVLFGISVVGFNFAYNFGLGVTAAYMVGVVLGGFAYALVLLARVGLPQAPEREPLERTEEELFRLADAWMIVAELMDTCDGEPENLDQDTVINGLHALDSAVNGEERCNEPAEFFERRSMALARMRARQAER